MIEVERREAVWITIASGVMYPGVVLWRRFGFVKVLFWDDDDEHYRATLFLPGADWLMPRKTEPWSRSCGVCVGSCPM